VKFTADLTYGNVPDTTNLPRLLMSFVVAQALWLTSSRIRQLT
jgi:hypothetical protein